MILEQIIGKPDRGVRRSFLSIGLAMSQAVGRIATLGNQNQPSFATAFLIAPDILITCHHVIPNLEIAKQSRFDLDFYELDDGTLSMPVSIPRMDNTGRILARDGSLWQSHSGTSFDTVANEAVRLSSIGAWLRSSEIDALGQARLPIDIRSGVDSQERLRDSGTPPFIPSIDERISRDSVFISYAHADQVHENWKDRLLVYLRGIKSIGEFRVWDDSRIQPGQDWRSEIEYALKRTKVAVLMIGPNFLASEFIQSNELPSILASSANEGVRILPIVTDYAPYKHTDLGRFQAINAPDAPLESLTRPDQNRLLLHLAETVAEAFAH